MSNAAVFVVTTTADGGVGSLRALITTANTNAQMDTITFNILSGSTGCTGFSAILNDILNPIGSALLSALSDNGRQTRTHELLPAGQPCN
jgi:hypothetical protein